MKASDVAELIEQQLEEQSVLRNPHGLDFEKCLVEPTLEDFEDSFDDGRVRQLWLVLHEDPVGRGGYRIVFDAESKVFGLAVAGAERDVFIGFYGSFVDTVEGM